MIYIENQGNTASKIHLLIKIEDWLMNLTLLTGDAREFPSVLRKLINIIILH